MPLEITPSYSFLKSMIFLAIPFIFNITLKSNCGNSNLNGKYYRSGTYKGMQDGIFWGSGTPPRGSNVITSFLARGRFYSFRTTEMKIRPMTDKEQRDMEDRYKPHGGRPPAG